MNILWARDGNLWCCPCYQLRRDNPRDRVIGEFKIPVSFGEIYAERIPRVSNGLGLPPNLWNFSQGLQAHIHPCLGSFLTSVLSCLAGYPVRCKFLRQQTSSTSVAYTLLGGFVVVVRPSCDLSDIQNRLMPFKYNLLSLVVKERVRCHDGQ
jgi:hypothetical protein